MDLNDVNVKALAECLLQTLSPDSTVRKQAERHLVSIEKNRNYSLLLLSLVANEGLDITIRTAGAITFKNFVKRNWAVEEGGDNAIAEDERNQIKQLIVDLMLKSPERIQRQLSDAIAEIGKSDFPAKWPNLIKEMTDRFGTGDFNIINGVLQTANTLFARYKFETRSDALWSEIKFVLDNFAQGFTELFFATKDLVVAHKENKEALKVLYGSLKLCCEIFEALTSQDVPEYFEDNMQKWMPALLELLTVDVPLLKTDNEEEPGIMEELRSVICGIVQMFALKYDEDLQPYLGQFVNAIWNLLMSTGKAQKFDLLVSNAINFLSSVASKDPNRSLFETPEVLDGICQHVILPNMEFRQTDEELFEDNPEEYIRRDVEGSDVDTRRRAACDLVRALSKFFEEKMTAVFGTYIQTMLASYAENPTKNWRNKDAAVYLVVALAAKGATQRYGTTQTNPLVNLGDFFRTHVVPDLQNPNVNQLPVLRADAIKYLMTFRNQLTREDLLSSIPCLISLLSSSSHVVHSYSAIALDKILSMKAPDTKRDIVQKEDLAPHAKNLLGNLLQAFSFPGSEENDHLMRALMRSLLVLGDQGLPFLEAVVTQLLEKLKIAAKNPSRPHYNHYIFESLCIVIGIVCKSSPAAVGTFEEALFPVFQDILSQDVQDFVPYVFQVLALLLELRAAIHPVGSPERVIPPPYMALYPLLLSPTLWERAANVIGLVRLLQAYLGLNSKQICDLGKLDALLGVFQKLISWPKYDHEGLNLLRTIVTVLPECSSIFLPEAMHSFNLQDSTLEELIISTVGGSRHNQQGRLLYFFNPISLVILSEAEMPSFHQTYLKQIFVVLFQRLTSSKTVKFTKNLVVFFAYFAARRSPQQLMLLVNGLQPNMFNMVAERLFLVEMQKISDPIDRKIAAVGVTTILCNSDFITVAPQLWTQLLEALLALFELPVENTEKETELLLDLDQDGSSGGFVKLAYAMRPDEDPLPEVADPKANLVLSLRKACEARPGVFPNLISGMSAAAQGILQKYLTATNVSLM